MTTLNIKLLTEKSGELANYITSLHFEQDPGLMQRYGTEGKKRCYEDAVFHLNFLVEAMTMKLPDIYGNYIHWAQVMLKSRNIPETDLRQNLDFAQEAIHEIMGSQYSTVTKDYINLARERLKENAEAHLSFITENNPLNEEVTAYLEYLLQGERRKATLLITKLIEQGTSIKDIYQHIFQVSQYEVGILWERNKITVAHEHYCTAATQQIISGLYHHIYSAQRKGKTLVACSISGELHEMGIRMVSDFFEMDGWDTYYLGANMPDHQLLEALKEYKADVLALSVTFPIYISKAASLIKKIRSNEAFNNLKIMVGGYPFLSSPDLWQRVAADASANNANEAITIANELFNQ